MDCLLSNPGAADTEELADRRQRRRRRDERDARDPARQLHAIEPWAYLRDLFCLLPAWPASRVLELAPAYCRKTLEQQDAQERLAANRFRAITLGEPDGHCQGE
jgi:hypothetical protein